MSSIQKLKRLRDVMVKHGLFAYIIPSQDAHNSEYVASRDERRAFISGFDGSAGTALVTLENAFLWTDGRYFLQAEKQLDKECWKLMKQGIDIELQDFLAEKKNFKKDAKIGIDPYLISIDAFKRLEKAACAELTPVTPNLIDQIWDDQPDVPSGDLIILDIKFSGEDHLSKIKRIRNLIQKENCTHLILTALDEIAWLLNLRGSDVKFNPVFWSYVLLSLDKVILYIHERKVTEKVKEHLGKEVEIRPYEEFVNDLSKMEFKENEKIWIDRSGISKAVFDVLPSKQLFEKSPTPVAMEKAIKNEIEIQGMKNAHLRDGIAIIKLLQYMEEELEKGNDELTEVSVSEQLVKFRKEQDYFISNSFETIAGMGPNGAIIHYRPTNESAAKITKDSLFLLDSGAQYLDGTTDTTRTVHFGTPTDYQKLCFTMVLKGHIGLDTAIFPPGTTGHRLDTLARMHLWKVGLDYRHGTGHGVGHFLNVHEGPHGIGSRPRPNDVPLKPGMIVTNEPGYYEDGQFGIRIENIEIVKQVETKYKFGDLPFLGFEKITCVPIQTKLIDKNLLSNEEIEWVNEYNKSVYEKLSPFLKNDEKILKWLKENTKEI